MSVLFWLLIIVHVIGCLVLIGLVLLQNDKAGGISGAFGGVSQNQAFTSAGAATFVSSLTKGWGIGLIVVVFLINLFVSHSDFGRARNVSAVQQALKDKSAQGAANVLYQMGAKPQTAVPQPAPAPGAPAQPLQAPAQ